MGAMLEFKPAAWIITSNCAALLLGLCLLAFPAGAAPQQLKHGMGYQQVIALLGEPQERVERETLRQDIWRYQGGQVFFSNGRLVAWTVAGAAPSGEPVAGEIRDSSPTLKAPKPSSKIEVAKYENLLTEILDSLPDDGSSAKDGIEGGISPISPVAPPPPMVE